MRKVIIGLLLFLSYVVSGQPGFMTVFDSGPIDIGDFEDVIIDNDTIVTYSIAFDENQVQGIRFVKMDTFGNVLQSKIYIDTMSILTTQRWRKKIIKTTDGGYAMMGSADEPYLLKVHHDLSLDFLQKYSSATVSLNSSLLEVNDGYWLVGEHGGDPTDFYIIKTDKSGNQIWRKEYGMPNVREGIIEIKQLDENSFLICGGRGDYVSGGQSTWGHSLFFMLDSLGEKKWEWESESGALNAIIEDFELLPDSSWICISGTWEWGDFGSYETRPMVFRMDKDFNVMWERVYPILTPIQFFTDLEKTPDGNYIASGWLDSALDPGIVRTKGVHFKFTPSGDTLWVRQDSIYPDSITAYEGTRVTGTDILSSGSIISVGYAQRYGSLNGSFGFVMKLSPDGCIDTLYCHPVANREPFAQAAKINVYPNPFQDELTVTLDSYPQATIYFYDVMGRFLWKERVGRGDNILSVSNLPKGLLFYEVRDSGRLIGRGKLVRID